MLRLRSFRLNDPHHGKMVSDSDITKYISNMAKISGVTSTWDPLCFDTIHLIYFDYFFSLPRLINKEQESS